MPVMQMPREIDADELPETLVEIAEVIGLPATLRLVEGWGGLRLYIPQPEHLSGEHPLVQQLGEDAARSLAEIYAREKVDIPRCLAAVRGVRNRRIATAHRQGMSVRRLAIEHHLTERAVWMILAADPEPREPDLFDPPLS